MRTLILLLYFTATFLDAFWNQSGASAYEAIGSWNYSLQNEWINSDNAGCTLADSETGTAIVPAQNDYDVITNINGKTPQIPLVV